MPDSDKKIIISADDFGQSPIANKNTLELLAQNKLHRISVMINGNFSREEINLLVASRVKIDLHLDLSRLLLPKQISEKKTGIFVRSWFFLKNYLSGKISVSQVEKEWTRQLEKFRVIFGHYPDGLNSHEHIHLFPPYFKLILALAQKTNITYLRWGKKDFVIRANIVSWIIFFLRKINRGSFLASRLISSDFLISLDWLKNNPSPRIVSLPQGEIELIVHPERTNELKFLKTLATLNF